MLGLRLLPAAIVFAAMFAGKLAGVRDAKSQEPARPQEAPQQKEITDWREWTSDDCLQVLRSSPWAQTVAGEWSGNDDMQVYAPRTVQFRSALPIRQALARRMLLANHYDQLDAAGRAILDRQVEENLQQDFRDTIVIRISGGTGQGPTAVLQTPDGKRYISQRTVIVQSYPNPIEFEVIFGRLKADGTPRLPPEGEIRIFFGWMNPKAKSPTMRVTGGVTFDLSRMMYRGKFEY